LRAPLVMLSLSNAFDVLVKESIDANKEASSDFNRL
jgi:hypothetical protein